MLKGKRKRKGRTNYKSEKQLHEKEEIKQEAFISQLPLPQPFPETVDVTSVVHNKAAAENMGPGALTAL